MIDVKKLEKMIENGYRINKEEACELLEAPLEQLNLSANELAHFYNKNDFDICAVVSARGGRCSENCKFCAQSSISNAKIHKTFFISADELEADIENKFRHNIRHYGIVASGRRISKEQVTFLCDILPGILKKYPIHICASLGLLDEEDFIMLKNSGVERIHNNLETSRRYFSFLCSSHTYDEKISTITAAKKAGLEICSGGIIGMGEEWEDRIDLAMELRKINPTSVPINILKPIEGTCFENCKRPSYDDIKRTISIFRFILPESYIRLAAGRDYLNDSGLACFKAGSNATITGDMLTIHGISIEEDLKNITGKGYDLYLH